MSISNSQEARLIELIGWYESSMDDMTTAELRELRYLAVRAYKEQRKQLAMMRGA